MNLVVYRRALPADAADCLALRGKTRQNAISLDALAAIGITVESWREGISSGRLPGFVGVVDDAIVGYCFGDRDSGEIMVLALLPKFENRGIGKQLFSQTVDHLAQLGHTRLFLACSANPGHRSHGFYRHMGWQSTGRFDANQDEILEYRINRTMQLKLTLL